MDHIKQIKEIIKEYNTKDDNDMKRLMHRLKRYFKSNPDANSIDTKDLNNEIVINGYVFCKRGSQQQLIKKYYIPKDSESKPSSPTIQSSNNDHEPISDRVKMKMNDVEARCKALDEEVIEIRQCIKDMTKQIIDMLDTIQGLQKAGYGVGNGYALYLNKSFSGN